MHAHAKLVCTHTCHPFNTICSSDDCVPVVVVSVMICERCLVMRGFVTGLSVCWMTAKNVVLYDALL